MSILEGELAATITEALLDADVPFDITVTRTVESEPDPATPWLPGETVTTHYPCKGFIEQYDVFHLSSTQIQVGDVKVVILVPTLAITPELTDTVTARGKSYIIVNVSPDPALATIELQARG